MVEKRAAAFEHFFSSVLSEPLVCELQELRALLQLPPRALHNIQDVVGEESTAAAVGPVGLSCSLDEKEPRSAAPPSVEGWIEHARRNSVPPQSVNAKLCDGGD